MWIRPTQLLAFDSGEATVGVNNEFMRGMISNHHLDAIKTALEQIVKEPVSVKIVVDTSILTDSYAPTIASISILPVSEFTDANTATSGGAYSSPSAPDVNVKTAVNKANLGQKYTFETFVVGSNNRFCHSAALAVAAKPGQSYNPLFLYGGVGLGKTHIMQAIGHEALQRSPHLSVRYITCERFTNE